MKKNILRVVSLVLVLGIVFAFTACTQKVEIRFVNQDGSDIDWSVLGGGSGGNNAAPVDNNTNNNVTPTPSNDTTPVDTTPSQPTDTTPTNAPANNDTPTSAPANNDSRTSAPANNDTKPSGGMPTSQPDIVAFYKTAANNAKAGQCGYTKKEYQTVGNLNITGFGPADKAIESVLGNYMTKEDAAEEQVNAKGSDDAKNRWAAAFPGDASLIATASCVADGSNYKLTLETVAENTPQNAGASKLAGVTQSILYWEDIDKELKNVSLISEYSNIEVKYNKIVIDAVMNPQGQFVSLSHTANVDIVIGHAKVIVSIDNKSAHMDNYCKYYNFQY